MTADTADPPPGASPPTTPAARLAPLAPTAARPDGPRLYSAAGIAAALGVKPKGVRKLYYAGRLPPAVHVNRRLRWLADAFDAWLAAGCPPRTYTPAKPRNQEPARAEAAAEQAEAREVRPRARGRRRG